MNRRDLLKWAALAAGCELIDGVYRPIKRLYALGGIGPDVLVRINGAAPVRVMGGVVQGSAEWTAFEWTRSDFPGLTFGFTAKTYQPTTLKLTELLNVVPRTEPWPLRHQGVEYEHSSLRKVRLALQPDSVHMPHLDLNDISVQDPVLKIQRVYPSAHEFPRSNWADVTN